MLEGRKHFLFCVLCGGKLPRWEVNPADDRCADFTRRHLGGGRRCLKGVSGRSEECAGVHGDEAAVGAAAPPRLLLSVVLFLGCE